MGELIYGDERGRLPEGVFFSICPEEWTLVHMKDAISKEVAAIQMEHAEPEPKPKSALLTKR